MFYRLEDNEIGFLGDFKTLEELFGFLRKMEQPYFVSIMTFDGEIVE